MTNIKGALPRTRSEQERRGVRQRVAKGARGTNANVVKLLVAVSLVLGASLAWGRGVVPAAGQPDVVYIGDGWPASLTNGCLDRHECDLPKIRAGESDKRAAVSVGPSPPDKAAWSRCMAKAELEKDPARSLDILAKCSNTS
jgi:hypothetical protein